MVKTLRGAGHDVETLGWPAEEDRYFAMLARADHLFVTADSVNLLSEACACGKAVYILGKGSAQGRPRRFCMELLEGGYAALPDAFPIETPGRPLREARRVATCFLDEGVLSP